MLRRILQWSLLAAGIALFVWLLARADVASVGAQIATLGLAGFGVILSLYALEFLADVLSWQLMLPQRTANAFSWCRSLYRVRLVGETLNVLTPLGGMGGEPVKAFILKRHHDVDLARGGASLVLAKTLNVLALVLFLLVGFALMLDDPRIDSAMRLSALAGLCVLGLGIGGFVVVQRLGFARRLGEFGARFSPRVGAALDTLSAFDAHILDAYRHQASRFHGALALGFANWIVGAASVLIASTLMGHDMSFADAWIIEAMTQMVRASTFIIPASIGAQEGILVLIVSTLTGRPDLGLALALVRRGREIVWLMLGAVVGWPYLMDKHRP